MSTVFVTGANGFIAQHIVVVLLDAGYRVIGSVRTKKKGDQLKKNLDGKNFEYEVVADLGKKKVFTNVLQKYPEIKYFLHTASPLSFDAVNPEDELLVPAIEGMKDVLDTINKYGPNIEKVVYTSSIVAVGYHTDSPSDVITEESWNPITWEQAKQTARLGYAGSKKFAEKAAWDFIKAEQPNFELSTVNPTYVFGPQAFESEVKDTLSSSNGHLIRILNLKSTDTLPHLGWTFIDVRDVAKAHLVSIENSETNGQRLLVSNTRFDSQLVADIVNQKFATRYAGKIPVGEPGAYKEIGSTVDDRKSRSLLGFEYIDFSTTIKDLVLQLLDYEQRKGI